MLKELPSLDPALIGRRLVEARKASGFTQEQAAAELGCSRPIFIAIEKGTRSAKPEELVRLARLYGRSLHELVRSGEPVMDWQPHFRAAVAKYDQSIIDSELNAAAEAMQRFANNYIELARMLDIALPRNYPDDVSLDNSRLSVTQLAESIAIRERQRLGLGDQPIADLRDILEDAIGIKTIYYPMPSHIAGMYAYIGDAGCCIMVNVKHPHVRRRLTAVHEYGHVIVDRHRPSIDLTTEKGKRPSNERFADSFGSAFLLPASGVSRRFNDIVMTTGDFQVADLCRMANYYDVSIEATCYRMEGLGLIPSGTMNILREGRFHKGEIFRELGLAQSTANRKKHQFPDRYRQLAVTAFERGELSEGQLARYLDCDPVTARETVFELSHASTMVDGDTGLMKVELENTLLARG